jgi:opacity protein-like surface antigen
MLTRAALAACVLSLTSSAAVAQQRHVWVTAGGGFTLPVSAVRTSFGTGWNAGMGFAVDVTDHVAVRLDVLHVRLADRARAVPQPHPGVSVLVTASHFMEAATASLRFAPRHGSRHIHPYVLGGGGIYYRKVTLTGTGSDLVSVCNPWWLVCPSDPTPVDAVLGRRNSVDVGVTLGAGFTAAGPSKTTVFLEARYHYIVGPAFGNGQPGSGRADGQYVPLTVGFRF